MILEEDKKGVWMMEIGEARIYEHEGRRLRIVRLPLHPEDLERPRPDALCYQCDPYLVNDVYVLAGPGVDMENPARLARIVDRAGDPFFPYGGADDGWAVQLFHSAGGGSDSSEVLMKDFACVRMEECEEALHEYRAWAGI